MKKRIRIILLIIFIFSSSLSVFSVINLNNEITIGSGSYKRFDDIYAKYGVKVLTEFTEMVPSSWLGGSVNGQATRLNSNLYDKAADIIEEALKEYPKSFLNANLKGIGILDTLSFYNVSYGGTANSGSKYVIIVVKDYSYDYTIGTIHHEFNHVLYRNLAFPSELWESYNSTSFSYGDGGVAAIQSGNSSTAVTDAALSRGFACQYGMSDIMEDVATFTENMAGHMDSFENRVKSYPIAYKKYQLLKKFYADNGCDFRGGSSYDNLNSNNYTDANNNSGKLLKYIYDCGYMVEYEKGKWENNYNGNKVYYTQYKSDNNYYYVKRPDGSSFVYLSLPVNGNKIYLWKNEKWTVYKTVTISYIDSSVSDDNSNSLSYPQYSFIKGKIIKYADKKWYIIDSANQIEYYEEYKTDDNYYYIKNENGVYYALGISSKSIYIWNGNSWIKY